MTNEQWRSNEVYRVGLPTQLKAEAILEKQLAEPMVSVIDHTDQIVKQYRKGVADAYVRRGRATKPKTYSAPLTSVAYKTNYDTIDWRK